jgi:hypothetical protein
MLRLLGVDAIVTGPFDPLATLAALAPTAVATGPGLPM